MALKRSLVIAGHKTSVSLENEFWDSLKEIASERGITLGELVLPIYRQLFDFLSLASIAIRMRQGRTRHVS